MFFFYYYDRSPSIDYTRIIALKDLPMLYKNNNSCLLSITHILFFLTPTLFVRFKNTQKGEGA